MYRKEVNACSPMRILEKSIRGGLGKGNLGCVMAPAGVGKTACLVQIGLDDLMRDRDIVHIAIGQSIEYVSAFYDVLFDELACDNNLEDKRTVQEAIARHRAIKAFPNETAFSLDRLEEALELFRRHMNLRPEAILVDGLPCSAEGKASDIEALKSLAERHEIEIWFTYQTPRGYDSSSGYLPASLKENSSNIDVALFLQPWGGHVSLKLVKDHGESVSPDLQLELHPDTLQLVPEGKTISPKPLPAAEYTLLSGGAPGAEAEFGICAERWGLEEVVFSFSGRGQVRSRGLIELTEAELRLGDVSSAYLKTHMHRTYPSTPLFKRVLQSIWHQVNTAGEVFSIGKINSDNTVTGGTGWAVELAKHWGKPVFLYDQEKVTWFKWSGEHWKEVSPPTITRERFTGTGTRFLTAEGLKAIQDLFERSFSKKN